MENPRNPLSDLTLLKTEVPSIRCCENSYNSVVKMFFKYFVSVVNSEVVRHEDIDDSIFGI